MFKKLSDENKQIVILISSLLTLPFLLLAANFLLPESKSAPKEKEKAPAEKTVIVTESKNSPAGQKKATPQQVAATVQEAIKLGNFSTAYMEINKVPQGSQEYQELSKALAAEKQKRKTPGVTREPAISQNAPIRYFDQSTPRDKSADAIYLYFIEISGTFWPRFCIQVIANKDPVITGLQVNADGKNITIPPALLKSEKVPKGIALLYDIPLDKPTYDIVRTLIKSKKATLTVIGTTGKTTRTISAEEIQGFTRILDGFEAVGGNLNYLKTEKPSLAGKKTPHAQ